MKEYLLYKRRSYYRCSLIIQLQNQEDYKLVQAALTDPEAFGAIINKFESQIKRYIKRITNLPVLEQEDLLQEVFIKVYQNLNAYNERYSLSSWIYRIAHNQTISYYRSFKPLAVNASEEDVQTIFDGIKSEINFLEDLEAEDLARKVRSAVEGLANKYKEVIVLHYLEERSYEEIADILKKPPGTIAIRLSRAKKQLASTLRVIIPSL